MQLYKAFTLQLIEHPRDVETAVAEIVGQACHQDVQRFWASGIGAVIHCKADKTLAKRRRRTAPGLACTFLCHRGQHVHQIEADDQEIIGEAQHLVLRQGDEMAGLQGDTSASIAGRGTEDGLWLQQPGCRQTLCQPIGAVVAPHGKLQRATDEEEQMTYDVAFAHNGDASLLFPEAELRIARHLQQLSAAEALKKLKAEQVVVELKGHDGWREESGMWKEERGKWRVMGW